MTELRDIEAEREYIRGLVHLHGRMRQRVPTADLWDVRHQTIAEAVAELQGERETINQVQVVRHLERSGAMREAGDAYVAELLSRRPDAYSLPAVADRLRELGAKRRLHEALLKAAAAAERSVPEARRIAHDAVEQAEAGVDGVRARTLGQAAEDFWRRVKEVHGGKRGAVRTGWPRMDRAMGALLPGSMTVIGGYQGTRKSSLMLGLALSMADLGFRVGIVTVEDAPALWGARAMNRESGVGSDVTAGLLAGDRTGRDSFPVLAEATEALQHSYTGVVVADATSRRTLDHVAGCMDALAHDHGCQVIFVDYLQAMRTDARSERRIGIADAAKALKATASRLSVALVLGSQLSRPADRDQTKEPSITQLKESGDLENEAENALLLWLESKQERAPTAMRLAKCKLSPNAGRRWRLEVAPSGAVCGVSQADEPEPQDETPRYKRRPEGQYPTGRGAFQD